MYKRQGEAALLAVDVPLPDGVTLRTITAADDVRRMTAMQDEVFELSLIHIEMCIRDRSSVGNSTRLIPPPRPF